MVKEQRDASIKYLILTRQALTGVFLLLPGFYAVVNFFSMHGYLFRGIHTNPYLVALDAEYCHGHVVANSEGFICFPCKY